MALKKTNLILKGAPLPVDFEGDLQMLFEAMIERLSILSPVGTNFFVVGDIEPSSDLGPWLKGGTQWWVFSATAGHYVPIDISASLPKFAFFQADDPGTPGDTDPLIWIRTVEDRIAGIYGWNGTAWKASGNIPNSGTTAQRPATPGDLEEYFDTDISVLLRFERGAWRTSAGSPGDVKATMAATLAAALTQNPGWSYLGDSDQSIRGRAIGMATKDPGATPIASFPTDSGISERASGDKAGAETVTLQSDEIEQHTHEIGHATALGANHTLLLHRVDDGQDLTIPAPLPPNHWQSNPVNGSDPSAAEGDTKPGTAGDGPTGTKFITATQYSKANADSLTKAAQPHENVPPTLYLWHLVKD
jgi:microcystin-dependent protein